MHFTELKYFGHLKKQVLVRFFENFGISRLVRTWSFIIGGGFFQK